jgi:ABC-2 type transport system permease protein
MTLKQKLYTVWAFFTVNLKRLFRDRLALFFTFLFPLIFLFVFGGLNSGNKSVSFKVAIINESSSQYSKQFVDQLSKQKSFEIDKAVQTFSDANEKMSRGELDATIQLPKDFGAVKQGQSTPSGEAVVHYTQNSASAAATLTTVLQAELQGINATLVKTTTPFTVVSKQNNERSLTSFDYAFTGLLGFSIHHCGCGSTS